jgi:hypothetical protein
MKDQTEFDDWPDDVRRPIALLRLSDVEMTKIIHGQLRSGTDGLDDMNYGIVQDFRVPSVIYRRPGSPPDEFTLMAHWNQSTRPSVVVDAFIERFALQEDRVLWRAR